MLTALTDSQIFSSVAGALVLVSGTTHAPIPVTWWAAAWLDLVTAENAALMLCDWDCRHALASLADTGVSIISNNCSVTYNPSQTFPKPSSVYRKIANSVKHVLRKPARGLVVPAEGNRVAKTEHQDA